MRLFTLCAFCIQAWCDFVWMIFLVFMVVAGTQIQASLLVRMRLVMTRALQKRIFAHHDTLFRLVVQSPPGVPTIDNYDQRLTDDLQSFLDSGVGMTLTTVNTLLSSAFSLNQVR